MKKAYNLFSELPFIKLDNNEVRVIEEALKICDRGFEFALKFCEVKEFEEQRRDFAWGRINLNNILARGNYHYYKKRKQYYENYSKYMRTVHGLKRKLNGGKLL